MISIAPADLQAVKMVITAPWSNVPLEGPITRLKMIKRQMYGQAGFESQCSTGRESAGLHAGRRDLPGSWWG